MDLRTAKSVATLVLAGLGVGAALTAVTSVASDRAIDAVSWLSTVATVGALVVAIGIYAAQRRDQDIARQELLDRLDAQDELLADLASREPAEAGDGDLSDEQRREVEKVFGPDSVLATWDTGATPGAGPRLVRLRDGRVATVYSAGHGRTVVRPLRTGRQGRQGAPERQSRQARQDARPAARRGREGRS